MTQGMRELRADREAALQREATATTAKQTGEALQAVNLHNSRQARQYVFDAMAARGLSPQAAVKEFVQTFPQLVPGVQQAAQEAGALTTDRRGGSAAPASGPDWDPTTSTPEQRRTLAARALAEAAAKDEAGL
jgi:hypothetical protein